jgi:sugar phosphate isomerase/epimerase
MKPAMSLYTYGGDIRTGRMTVKDAIDHAAGLGVRAVEVIDEQHLPNWPYTSAAQILELKDYVHSLGMEVCCFSAYLPDMIRSDRRATVAEITQAATDRIVIAHLLGAKVVRPAYIGTGFQDLLRVVLESIPVLEKYDIVWGLEIHAPFKPLDYLNLYNAAFRGCPHVKVIPDFSCWQSQGLPTEYGSEPVESIKALVPITTHVHGKAHVFDAAGEEPNTPYRALMSALKEGGFEEYIVAEYEGWLLRYEPSREVATTHMNLIKKYL